MRRRCGWHPGHDQGTQLVPTYAGHCSIKFQVSGPPAVPIQEMKLDVAQGPITYAEGVTAGSPGLALRSELPWV